MEKTSQALLHVASEPARADAMKQARLAPGEELSLDLPGGAAAVRESARANRSSRGSAGVAFDRSASHV